MDERIQQLKVALEDAQDYLEWIGWGDKYERECAKNAGLPEKIQAALDVVKEIK